MSEEEKKQEDKKQEDIERKGQQPEASPERESDTLSSAPDTEDTDTKQSSPAIEVSGGEVLVNKEDRGETTIPDQVVTLNGLFGFKLGMASVYSEKGIRIPVTVLKVKSWTVTQIKTRKRDHYDAVQISLLERSEKNVSLAEKGHLKNTSSKKGALFSREIRGQVPEGIQVGQKVDVTSFEKGSKIKLTATSKGRGFTGTMKRFNFKGGPAAHGSTFHRQPGSVGNRTWPGRIIPGKKLPGHFGNKTVTVKNVEIVDVQKEEGLILVKGSVPGPPKGLVRILRQ